MSVKNRLIEEEIERQERGEQPSPTVIGRMATAQISAAKWPPGENTAGRTVPPGGIFSDLDTLQLAREVPAICENCWFWDRHLDARSAYGLCRWGAPREAPHVWPTTGTCDGCSKFRPRPGECASRESPWNVEPWSETNK